MDWYEEPINPECGTKERRTTETAPRPNPEWCACGALADIGHDGQTYCMDCFDNEVAPSFYTKRFMRKD